MRRRGSLRMPSLGNKSPDSADETELDYQPKNNNWSRELRNRYIISSGKSLRSLRLENKEGSHPRRSIRSCRYQVLARTSHYAYPSEDDDRIFTPRLSPRRPRHNNYRDAPSSSKQEDGIRRSTRQRKLKYDNYNDSWICGAQSLRGYPSFAKDKVKEEIPEGEEEEEEEEGEEPEEEDREETTTTNGEKEMKQENGDAGKEVPERRTRQRKQAPVSSQQKGESGEEEEGNSTGEGGFEDMYARVKQRRRQVAQAGSSSDSSSSLADDTEPRRRRLRTRSCREAARVQRKYSLRETKPTVDRFQPEPVSSRNRVLREVFGLRKRKRRRSTSSSSSTSTETRYDRKKDRKTKSRNRLELCGGDAKASAGLLADVGPVALDKSITFSNVGGLENHVACLKEMVVFPILYPEVFQKFGVTPPKGVLFHGPPGTGKTLMARALANECSHGSRKVAFFMRKGADVLSKWVGESERQLRILFEQAQQARPSIIFFDELDGLAPVRSTKQDQIHASIVCTLLALMDGLDNRGDIVIIGATNRIDSIDPALRRPGRFDRELHFPLPGVKERREILGIHSGTWADKEVLNRLAETTVGYCGSDLRSLCTEAVIQALKRIYPQIYNSSQKLLINHERVQVERCDFDRAQRGIVPAAQRALPSLGRKLPQYLEPLLGQGIASLQAYIGEVFPAAFNRAHPGARSVRSPRLLLVGREKEVSLLTAGLLYKLEHCPMSSLALDSLYADSSRSPEEAITKVFKELPKNRGSVLWFGDIDLWWSSLSSSARAVFTTLLCAMDPSLSILFLATSSPGPLTDEGRILFSEYRGEVYRIKASTEDQLEAFFRPLFRIRALRPPPPPRNSKVHLEQLEVAPPPPPPKLSDEQMKAVYNDEENTLRELRIFLRQICAKLARNKQFYMFSKPVDIQEVPDYLQIIKEPMDLESMMTKIDLHKYTCAQDFLSDIDLLCKNALEYNPDRDPADKLIRHRACYLRDTAYALIKAEMDSDFEVNCRDIREARKQREEKPSERFVQQFFKDENEEADESTVGGSTKENNGGGTSAKEGKEEQVKKKTRRMRSSWSKGCLAKKPKRSKQSPDTTKEDGISLDASNCVDSKAEDEEHVRRDETEASETEATTEKDESGNKLMLDRDKLKGLHQKTVDVAKTVSHLEPLIDLYSSLRTVIDSYRTKWERESLPKDLEKELKRFVDQYDGDQSS